MGETMFPPRAPSSPPAEEFCVRCGESAVSPPRGGRLRISRGVNLLCHHPESRRPPDASRRWPQAPPPSQRPAAPCVHLGEAHGARAGETALSPERTPTISLVADVEEGSVGNQGFPHVLEAGRRGVGGVDALECRRHRAGREVSAARPRNPMTAADASATPIVQCSRLSAVWRACASHSPAFNCSRSARRPGSRLMPLGKRSGVVRLPRLRLVHHGHRARRRHAARHVT